jgi:N-acetyl sugar amidotransferase
MNSVADPGTTFSPDGICSHCQRFDRLLPSRVVAGANRESELHRCLAAVRAAGVGREYDCVIGLSGGVDSSYVAWLVKSHGLRPLAVHFDNGWNTELATKNIERVVRTLGIDLYTFVIDWPEFRDLQRAFLLASVPDGEIPTDHAIFALLWREAARRGIRFIISGMNFATESVSVPSWSYGHSDWRYIKDVSRRFGSAPLKTYPHFSMSYLGYVSLIKRVRTISILNYTAYGKSAAVETLSRELGWQPYGGKHHESVYTRFFQGYVLPRKFGVDKRYGHLSDLINSGQLSREEAMAEIARPPYSAAQQEEDRVYVAKKLGFSLSEFDEVLGRPPLSFRDFRNSYWFVEILKRTVNLLRGAGVYPR